ncbi:MAG: O-acetyl-ADP-ribose deacetylase [Alphaproteobacteria bacterium]
MPVRIAVVEGDITLQAVDAIVNAANAGLRGGGGVDGAIHRKAGPRLMEACRAIGFCPTGEARITPGFDLPARHVIHAVGPVWEGGGAGEDAFLAGCHRHALLLARGHGLRTISFPAISTGVYGFPMTRAARIALSTVAREIARDTHFTAVRFVCFGVEATAIFETARAEIAG